MMGNPTSKCFKSRTINYMGWEMIPLLDATGKERISEYVNVCLVTVVFKVVTTSGRSYGCRIEINVFVFVN